MISTTQTIIPGQVRNVIDQATAQLTGAQAGLPNLLALAGQIPELNVPGLDATQQNVLAQLIGAGTNNPDLTAARAQLGQLTSGPIGSSPLTQQGMQAYQQLVAPQIEQQAALRGTAGGGQAIEALGQGATQAALPLIQQEIAQREQAVGQYGALGNQQMQQSALALEASGLPREVALEQAQAAFNQQQQQFGYETGLQTYPLQLIPATFGTKTHGTMTAEDWISGAAKGISPSGIFGGGGGGA